MNLTKFNVGSSSSLHFRSGQQYRLACGHGLMQARDAHRQSVVGAVVAEQNSLARDHRASQIEKKLRINILGRKKPVGSSHIEGPFKMTK